ncbi:MAG TPA: complex I NDUFA9 subunit family protein [Rhodospirillaceae bacterium]|nr:complex I NDUFA9 subunit family protein [Rhodospirillaceae bacterium]
MSGRLATVFGGSGFIGRHVVQRLAAQGWRVRVAIRDPEAAHFLQPRGDVGQVLPVFADLAKDFSVQAAVAGADLVINLVGILYERGKQTFQAVHVDGAARVAAAAKAAGVTSLVHMSAMGADPASASAYSRSKAAGEAAVRAAFAGAVILRPSAVFGPEDDLFNRFAQLATFSPLLPVYVSDGFRGKGPFGSGGTKMQLVYVGDVAEAVVRVAAAEWAGKTFELAGPTVYSLRQIIQMSMTYSGRQRWLVPMPLAWAKVQALFLQLLPKPPLTCDQVLLLAVDNLPTAGTPGLADLGITPTSAEVIVPTYLSRFKNPFAHINLA